MHRTYGVMYAGRRAGARPVTGPRLASDHFLGPQQRQVLGAVAELGQHLLGVLAQQRRARHLGRAVRHLDRIAHRGVAPARRVVALDDRAAGAQRRVRHDLLHRQDGTARDVELVEDGHRLQLRLRLRPLLDAREDRLLVQQPGGGRLVGVVVDPAFLADDLAHGRPDRGLRDEVDVGVRIGLPALALEDRPGLAAAGGVAGARHGVAELAVRILRILLEHAGALEALLVAQLHAAQVQHRVLHRREHALAAARGLALEERRHDAQRQVQARSAVADLRAADGGRPVVEAGRRRGAAGALGDVLVDLAILVHAWPEALDRREDHARVHVLDVAPRDAHAI